MPYGLSSIITFSAGSLTPVAGTANLFTSPVGPEGLLYKRITTFAEAVDCGGLMLFGPASSWMFYAGATLTNVLSANLLGKFVINSGGLSAAIIPDAVGHQKWRSNETSPGHFRRVSTFGWAEISVLTQYMAMFGPSDIVDLWGIITPAHNGHGHNFGKYRHVTANVATDTYSFMSTDTPMRVPLKSYLADQKAAYLASVPANVRPYYAQVYNGLAALEESRPRLSAITTWKNGLLAPLPVVKDRTLVTELDSLVTMYGSGGMPGFGSTPAPYANFSALHSAVPFSVSNDPDSPTTAPGFAWIAEPGTVATEPSRGVRFRSNLGVYLPETGILPCLSKMPSDVVDRVVTPAAGTIDGYQVGALRDGHVMARRLVSLLKYEDEVSPYATLAAYVDSTRVANSRASLIPYSEITDPVVGAALSSDTTRLATLTSNAFSVSALPLALERFCSRLDDSARAAAEAG